MDDAEWMTLEEARGELGLSRGYLYTRLLSAEDEPLHLEGRKAANGRTWAGVSRRSVMAYRVAQAYTAMVRAERARTTMAAQSLAARKTKVWAKPKPAPKPRGWQRTVSKGEPRCPECTSLVGVEGDLCEMCEALADGPYYQFRPAVGVPAVVWDQECVVNL